MTTGRNFLSDREATKELASRPSERREGADVEPNWLGHTGGAAGIDRALLDGATMDQLLAFRKTEGAVLRHIGHLKTDHGLLVQRGNLIRFSRFDLELQEDASPYSTPPPGEHPDGPSATALTTTAAQVTEEGYFSLTGQDDREWRLREIVLRRGQPEFRTRLMATYGGRCAVTGCDAVAALEAAHIVPYTGPQSNHVTNGLLLRADIHTLFDLDLIGIDPKSMAISLAPAIKATVYAELDGKKLLLPVNATDIPNHEAVAERWGRFCGENGGAG